MDILSWFHCVEVGQEDHLESAMTLVYQIVRVFVLWVAPESVAVEIALQVVVWEWRREEAVPIVFSLEWTAVKDSFPPHDRQSLVALAKVYSPFVYFALPVHAVVRSVDSREAVQVR